MGAVPFTVIGTIAWVEYYAQRSWHWVDHQVYSPTHGYGWLTVEGRVRDLCAEKPYRVGSGQSFLWRHRKRRAPAKRHP